MKILKVLTDNGSPFSDRFTAKDKRPTGKHAFDLTCDLLNIEHRLCPPRHPSKRLKNGRLNPPNYLLSAFIILWDLTAAANLLTMPMQRSTASSSTAPKSEESSPPAKSV